VSDSIAFIAFLTGASVSGRTRLGARSVSSTRVGGTRVDFCASNTVTRVAKIASALVSTGGGVDTLSKFTAGVKFCTVVDCRASVIGLHTVTNVTYTFTGSSSGIVFTSMNNAMTMDEIVTQTLTRTHLIFKVSNKSGGRTVGVL